MVRRRAQLEPLPDLAECVGEVGGEKLVKKHTQKPPEGLFSLLGKRMAPALL